MRRQSPSDDADVIWRRRLEANHDYIVKHLMYLWDVTDHLMSCLIFSHDDVDYVRRGDVNQTQKETIRRFLECLSTKGPDAYGPFLEALNKTQNDHVATKLKSTDMSKLFASGPPKSSAEGRERGAMATDSGANSSTVNIYARNVYMAPQQTVNVADGPSFSTGVTERSAIQELCPESLLLALLKEILFHCHQKREAMYTLEDKLCQKLREQTGNDIVSFKEHFHFTFSEFLDKHSDHFEVFLHGNEYIVSRVVDSSKYCAGNRSSSFGDEKQPNNPWHNQLDTEASRVQKQPNNPWHNQLDTEASRVQKQPNPCSTPQREPLRMKIPAAQRKKRADTQWDCLKSGTTSPSEPESNVSPQGESPGPAAAEPEPEMCPGKAASALEPPPAVETYWGVSKTLADINSLIERCLSTEPSNTLLFRVSDEAYAANPVQLTMDVTSLWNTPDRGPAYIVVGIKPLVRLPHQLVGLKRARGSDFYKATFLWRMFDFPPSFTYRETSYEGKLVGVVQVGNSAGCCQPSIVKSDDRKSKLKKNQLWYRKQGRNAAVSGSDMNKQHVREIYSWFMRLPGNPPTQCVQPSADSSAGFESVVKAADKCTESADESTSGPQQSAGHSSDTASMLSCLDTPDENRAPAPSQPDSVSSGANPVSTSSTLMGESKRPSQLMQAVKSFRRGHYVLMCGTLPHTTPNLDALACVPWLAVYDFDVSGRTTGLLAYLEPGLLNRRSAAVLTWLDPHVAVTERGTQWWSLRGRLELPESDLSALSPMKWLHKVCSKLEKLCAELARLSQDYTVLSVLVLWPTSREERKCMQQLLRELHKRIHVQPSVFLCFTDPLSGDGDSFEVQTIVEDCEDSVWMGVVDLEGFCAEVDAVFSSGAVSGAVKHQLPGGEAAVDVSVDTAAWLRQDLEVLYLHNPYTNIQLTAEDLQAEGDNFFRGGSLSWLARYDMGATCFDIERCHYRDVTKHISKQHVEKFRGGVVRLLHAPGSGGSTMAQRVLFDLHEAMPCVHVKQRSGSKVEDVAGRLRYLADHTHMPVVALLDGEDDQKLQLLGTHLLHCTVIFIHVKRYPYKIDQTRMFMEHRNMFYVQGVVTKKESRNLVIQFNSHCCDNEGKKRALRSLDEEVQQDRQRHQMFEYGLTVFNHEFRGVQAYVKGFLQVTDHRRLELESWQTCLGYLALVYYYAQVSLPCYFVGKMIGGSREPVLDIGSLPYAVQMLVVPDVNEGKRNYVRVMHYTVAKEILELVLNPGGQSCGSENLSEAAKENLKQLCLDFLDHVVSEGSTGASSALQSVLTKTFILRDVADMGDGETETKKKPQFSAILLDMDSKAPFEGRLKVLQKLCEVCPEDASLRAHLGRFYSLCRPHEEQEAERHFEDAVKIAKETEEHPNKIDLAYIYHMYGCFLKRRMNRKISAIPGSVSLQDVIQDAEHACLKFSSCRHYAPPAYREAHQYFGEMDLRLQACRFLNRSMEGGLSGLLQPQQTRDEGDEQLFCFVKGSIVEVQDLFMECANSILLDNTSLAELQGRVGQFNATFRGVTRELQALAEDDPITCLRLKVTAKKLQYAFDDKVVAVENPGMPREMMSFVVDTLEQIFQHSGCHGMPDKLELDYRDWILAIRHPHFPKIYSVDRVLEDVRRWGRSVEGTQSMASYYLFILVSLQGMGTSTTAGHDGCVADARALKAKMQKQSRADPKARLPREWLGSEDQSGIRRLVSQGYVPMEDHRVKVAARSRLTVCKGTVKGKPKKSSGFITMDLLCAREKAKGNKYSTDVFFVPAHMETAEPLLNGTRVQFYLAFTQANGYQAYEVSRLERIQCTTCGLWVEVTKELTSVRCPGKIKQGKPCNGIIYRKDHDRANVNY